MAPYPFPKGGINLTHRILVNMTDRPMKHPLTGQTIMPGQSYAEPEEIEPQELKEPADPLVTVQSVADPESTKKATVKATTATEHDKSGDE